MSPQSPPVRNALLSVSDKSGLLPFAQGLVTAGVTLYASGGTRQHLEKAGLEVREVSSYTNFPEMLDGRLKTLHPKIHGGILCRHDHPDDIKSLSEHGIVTFELVVVNLYPFEQTIARPGVTYAEAIEKIDIGGPTLVRGAAKNHAFTTIATDSEQYEEILAQIRDSGATTPGLRQRLATKAFVLTAAYDTAISSYLQAILASESFPVDSSWEVEPSGEQTLPTQLQFSLPRIATLRYGENPHQSSALYADPSAPAVNLVSAKQLNGKELSYNNYLDLDAALSIVRLLDDPAVSVVKHNNPCGAAVAQTLAEATQKATEGDPLSAFGSVLGFNRPVDAESAEILVEPGKFIEAIVAPGFESGALEVLTTKPKWKANVRLMELGSLPPVKSSLQLRHIEGGFLVQQIDNQPDPHELWEVVTDAKGDDNLLHELQFAWEIVRHVKSNAIALCRDRMLIGTGAGQMSRVDSVQIAIQKAGDRASGSVLASDAFFPFPDSIDVAAAAGIAAIIQPGGSRRDNEVIAACNRHGLPMIFTGRRHFKH